MISSQRLFREYILLRSRVVVYVAVALAIFGLSSLVVLAGSSAENANRFGLALQIAGILSVLPHVIGKEEIRKLQKRWSKRAGEPENESTDAPNGLPALALPDGKGGPSSEAAAAQVDPAPTQPFRVGRPSRASLLEAFFYYYQTRNLPVVIGNLCTSFLLMWLLVAFLPGAQSLQTVDHLLLRSALSLIGFAWLNFYMLIHLYLLFRVPPPGALMSWFFSADLVVALLGGVIIAGVVQVFISTVRFWLRFVSRNGIKTMLLTVALPFLTAGILLELLATFY